MSYRRLFEQTRARLETRGIAVKLEFGPDVSPLTFEELQQASGLPIPQSLRQFYSEIGDGLTFHWSLNDNEATKTFCRLNIPTLTQLLVGINYLQMLNDCLADHDFRETAHREYQRQLTYFPFLTDNTDLICIEPTAGQEAVVFHDHEWSFYTTGDSGILLANSLKEFWHGWSEVGFVEPLEHWWPKTTGSAGTIWSVEEFGFQL